MRWESRNCIAWGRLWPGASSGGMPSDYLEKARKNCARTRNHRLAALHSFFRHVAVTEPALALQCQQVLAMPCKRYERRTLEFLTEEECAALLATPNLGTWVG